MKLLMINSHNKMTLSPSFELARHTLQGEQKYQLVDVHAKSSPLNLWCSNVAQRNWSRIATGISENQEGEGQRRLFLKQYISRTGQWNEKLWKYEHYGVQVACEVLGKHVGIPRLVASDRSHLVNAFEYIDIVSMDELLRTDNSAFDRVYPVALECMTEVLELLENPELQGRFQLPRKYRNYGDSNVGINFKGFEFRNMGVKAGVQKEPTYNDFFLFDFVRPYMAPIQEAAAKVIISIGLLNWGRPLNRFSRGPDLHLMEEAKSCFAPYLDHKAVEAELRLQRSFRWAEIQGTGILERSFKRLAITTLGGRYFHQLENWCRNALR